jgi:hypothetical protein
MQHDSENSKNRVIVVGVSPVSGKGNYRVHNDLYNVNFTLKGNIFIILLLYSCNKNESQYKCPKCFIEYCSLNCFKDEKHSRCTEKFYQDQIKEALKAEKISELSDERDKMIKILEKLKNLEAEDSELGDFSESDDSNSIYEALVNLNIEDLSVKEIEEILGEKHLKNVQELIEKGVTTEWLSAAGIIKDDPWFTRYTPSDVILNEELPDFVPVQYNPEQIPDIKTLTKKTPSDFLWNNLLEITVIYSFLYQQFTQSEFQNREILEMEIKPIFLELCSTIQQSTKKESLYMSAIEALEAAKSVILFNSTDNDMDEILSGTDTLLRHVKLLILMLTDIKSWFKNLEAGKDSFYAEKKLKFLLSWLNFELNQSKVSVEEILKTLRNIVEQFKQ